MNEIKDCHTQRGTVIKTRGELAFVEHTRSELCNGCKGCVLGKNENKIVFPVKNTLGAIKGDTVEFSSPPEKPLFAVLMLFLVPLVLLLVGLGVPLALGYGELTAFVCSLLGAFVGFIAVMLFDRFIYSKKYIAITLQIIKTQGDNND